MRSILISALSLMAILFALDTAQASVSCSDLTSELHLMRKAQNQIIMGLADNHQQMANSMDEISAQLRFYNKPAPLKLMNGMNGTSKAFRKRGLQAKDQGKTLDRATMDLIRRIEVCLK